MLIKGVSEVVRLPRLGRIRLNTTWFHFIVNVNSSPTLIRGTYRLPDDAHG